MSREIRYYAHFTGFSAHSLHFLEMKHIYYVLRLDTFCYEILRNITNNENDQNFIFINMFIRLAIKIYIEFFVIF